MAGSPGRKRRNTSRRAKSGRGKRATRAKNPPKPKIEEQADAARDVAAEERRAEDRRKTDRRQGDRRQGDRRTDEQADADDRDRQLEQVRETVSAWEALRAEQDEAEEADRKRGRLFRRRD